MSTSKGVKPIRGTGDLAIYFDRCRVFWFTCKSGATASTYQINDSGNNSGDDVWDVTPPASGSIHCVFDPPMLLTKGLYIDTDSNVSSWIVGALPGWGEEDES